MWLEVGGRIRFFVNRARERLWIKPLMFGLLSVLAAFLAGLADHVEFARVAPEISADSIETLLKIISASMLVIAVFAVGAMLAAYTSASNAATPRAFAVVIADDVSQNALSTFIGAFIFSIIALIALLNGYYESPGRFALFLLTIFVFAVVILSFVRWVDRIARLGRLGTIVDKVEDRTTAALRLRRRRPRLGGTRAIGGEEGLAVHARAVGYVQRVDVATLQSVAEKNRLQVTVAAPPGTFVSPAQPLAYVNAAPGSDEVDTSGIVEAFVVGGDRTFDEDPRFGLVVLSEIASRALSPAVNDPGTAIDIIGTLVRLFTVWAEPEGEEQDPAVEFDRVAVPEISANDMFDDAFNAVARDGAATVEVAIRLQKAFYALASLGGGPLKEAAIAHARFAFRYAEQSLKRPEEIEALRRVSTWADSAGQGQPASDAG